MRDRPSRRQITPYGASHLPWKKSIAFVVLWNTSNVSRERTYNWNSTEKTFTATMISIQELESFFSARISFAAHKICFGRSNKNRFLFKYNVFNVYDFIISVLLGICLIFSYKNCRILCNVSICLHKNIFSLFRYSHTKILPQVINENFSRK